jgi:hypothetical protein
MCSTINATLDNTPPYDVRLYTTNGTLFHPVALGDEAEVKALARDNENHDLFFKLDWGDNTPLEWQGPYTPEEYHFFQHVYDELPPGGEEYYTVQVWVIDDPNGDGDPSDGMQSPESPTTKIYIEEIPDLGTPEITGPAEGYCGSTTIFDMFVPDDSGPRNIGLEWDINGELMGPSGYYPSATPFNVSRVFNIPREYTIQVRAWVRLGPMSYVNPSDWSNEITITIKEIEIDVSITTGLGITATLENTGDIPAPEIEVTLTVTGGVLKQIDITQTETIENLPPDGIIEISALPLGLGPLSIQLDVVGIGFDDLSLVEEAKIFLIFIF